MRIAKLREKMLSDIYFSHPDFINIDLKENWIIHFSAYGDEKLIKKLVKKLKPCDHPFIDDKWPIEKISISDSLFYKNCSGRYVFINEAYSEYWDAKTTAIKSKNNQDHLNNLIETYNKNNLISASVCFSFDTGLHTLIVKAKSGTAEQDFYINSFSNCSDIEYFFNDVVKRAINYSK